MTNPTRPAPMRGKAYYTELKRIRDEIAEPLTADFLALKAAGKNTLVGIGWLALKYDVNLKAMFEILNDLKLILCCPYDEIVTYGGVKVGVIFDEARKFDPEVERRHEDDTTTGEILTARALRLAVVQQQYDAGNLTEAEARELLAGPLTPGDEATVYDDSGELKTK